MRSVVVVLPASMCAMMPMLRTLVRSVVMSTATSQFLLARWCQVLRTNRMGCPRGARSCRITAATGAPWRRRSPAVVREGLVGLGHLVGVLTTLHSGAEAVGGVQDLVHQALGHRLLTAGGGVADQPAQRERHRPGAAHLDGDLVGRATDAAAADLERRLDVVERTLERHDGVGAGLVAAALEGAVHDPLRGLLLAVLEDLADQLGDDLTAVHRVDVERPLRSGTLAGH